MIAAALALVIFGTFLGSVGALMLKKGSGRSSGGVFGILKNRSLILGFVLYGLSAVPFIIALKFGPISVLYPFTSLSYVWTIFLSMKYLGEKMNPWKWAGIALVLLGVSLIGTG
jgi:uncharacterized membrane protein